jgi:hypothetical protein
MRRFFRVFTDWLGMLPWRLRHPSCGRCPWCKSTWEPRSMMAANGGMCHDCVSRNEPIEFMYADPIDEDGNKLGTVTFTNVTASWGPVRTTKVPYDELGLPRIQGDDS